MANQGINDEKENIFLSNEFNRLPNAICHIMRRSFMESQGNLVKDNHFNSKDAYFQESLGSLPSEVSNFNQRTPFLSRCIGSEIKEKETMNNNTPFKSASDLFSLEESHFIEDKLVLGTDEDIQKETKKQFFHKEDDHLFIQKVRSNSLDEVLSQIYNDAEDHEKCDIDQRKKGKISIYTFLVLLVLLLGSIFLSSAPVFSCNSFSNICYPQLTVKLTDKSPAAKTALLTVREALKVLSYLAIDFGDSESNQINESLDNYYQSQVIDTFNVNTTYQLNFLGYCRLSDKNLKTFCMRSYGFDILAVFVRDAGVQLGELTKTNLKIMGDSFSIAYELAVKSISQLNMTGSKSNEYTEYAMLLQKFSKGLGVLSYSQFVMVSMLMLLITGSFILSFASEVYSKNSTPFRIIHESKKWIVIFQTLIGFLNLLISFLIVSLTLEYVLRLKDLAEQVGIANVTSGTGLIFIWITFALNVGTLISVLYLANSFRKKIF